MSGQLLSQRRSVRRSRPIVASVLLALALVVPATPADPAFAATPETWQAKVGSGGANGTVTLKALASGTGTLVLKLVKLKASTSMAVVLTKGTCTGSASTFVALPSVRSSAGGAITKTMTLTAAQVTKIRSATKGTGKLSIRVGGGTARKCGVFVAAAPPAPIPTVTATIPVGVVPTGVTIDTTGVWVANWYDNSLSRIDPKANVVLSVTTLPIAPEEAPDAVVAAFGSIWVTVIGFDAAGEPTMPGKVLRIDPVSGNVIGSPIPVGRLPIAIAASPEAIWVSNYGETSVTRIDPATNAATATIALGGTPVGLAAGYGSIWVARESDGKVDRIDPATNQVIASVQTQRSAAGLAIGAGAVWVTYCGCGGDAGVVSRIDPATNSVVAAIPTGSSTLFAAFGGGFVWVAVDGDTSVVQVDPATNTVRKVIPVGAKSWGIAASDHTVWVVHPIAAGRSELERAPGTVTRIDF